MKGDFSNWEKINRSLSGVLHQQGRVLLDRDWNDQTRITNDWQDRAARDIIGSNLLAIPANSSEAFLVTDAKVDGSRVLLKVNPGSGWTDGLLVHLASDVTVEWDATYLPAPFNDPSVSVTDITEGIRDAVVLEVWRETLNAFQVPKELIEPALGGVDTTERIQTSIRFRLMRLDKKDTCNTIATELKEGIPGKGRLTVTLQPTNVIPGDCPVVEGGGYVGFEHALFRIEIADTDGTDTWFKWSQFNGGLVGRGEYDATEKKFTITDNDQAIKMSGLTEFYLEVVEFNEQQGCWLPHYGAEVILDNDDLNVTTEHLTVAPVPAGRVFFRLWNKIEKVINYPVTVAPADPQGLTDGIRLEFDSGSYRPGDYWTFDVRAGEIANPDTLIDDQPPDGVEYHRVPVAILNWNAAKENSFADDEIDDCRDVFRPLSKQATCCSLVVGDGVQSFGDFNSVEEALHHLPKSGGEICLLPGEHKTNTVIAFRKNIKIKGCGPKTLVVPRQATSKEPIFTIKESAGITLEHMELVTFEGSAIVGFGAHSGKLEGITIHHNRILAAVRGIDLTEGYAIKIQNNRIRLLDKQDGDVGIFLEATDGLIERNNIGVIPAGTTPEPDPDDDDIPEDPTDPCADPQSVYTHRPYLLKYVAFIWAYVITVFFPENPYAALGGIQIASGSENIKVLENVINGGAGNGITLGSGINLEPDQPREREGGDLEGDRSFQIEHKADIISGYVTEEGVPVNGISLMFTNIEDSTSVPSTSEEYGYYSAIAPPGIYEVTTPDPSYQITGIEIEDLVEFGVAHNITVKAVEPEEMDLFDILAFIYEVSIDQNKISNMGSSGIGIPEIALDQLTKLLKMTSSNKSQGLLRVTYYLGILTGSFGGYLIDLEIYRNQIFNCLQNDQSPNKRKTAPFPRGAGGISLGLCEGLSIRENRIEDNGRVHLEPVCGIFIGFGDQVDISHNKVINNGPLDPNRSDWLSGIEPGARGGIVLNLVSSLSILNYFLQQEDVIANAGPAARIHDNVVNQPVGQALRMLAYGPVSVLDNYFNSELTGRDKVELVAGTVLISNIGESRLAARGYIATNIKSQKLYVAGESAGLPIGSSDLDAKSNISIGKDAKRLSQANGNTLFANNQIRNGPSNLSTFSQVINAPKGDIGYSDNQSEDNSRIQIPAGANKLLAKNANTLLWGGTVRANSSRFEEPQILISSADPLFASLIVQSKYMNTTTVNQADHCIVTYNDSETTWPTVADGNLIFDPRGCKARILEVFEVASKIYVEGSYAYAGEKVTYG